MKKRNTFFLVLLFSIFWYLKPSKSTISKLSNPLEKSTVKVKSATKSVLAPIKKDIKIRKIVRIENSIRDLTDEEKCFNKDFKFCLKVSDQIEESNGNPQAAADFLIEACKNNYYQACQKLGNIFFEERDFKKALKYYQISCDKANNVKDCYRLGRILLEKSEYEGGNTFDLAWQYLLVACEQNSSESCYTLGQVFENRREEQASLLYYKKACQMDSSDLFEDCQYYRNL